MKSFRWRIALWFTFSLMVVMFGFVTVTNTHLQHELRMEKWERSEPGKSDWILHGNFSEAEVDDIAGELWHLSLLYAIPVALLTLVLGYYLAQRSFRPVAELNRQLQAISARSLHEKVQLNHADHEFRTVENHINALLTRLDTSFRQLTEFSAQVAHELRTPLTLLRLQVEEAADRIEPALAESLQEELSRLSDYVDQCLLLARAEQGRLGLEIKPVPLHRLVTEMIEIYELLARSENRVLTVVATEESTVPADERSLRQMLHNLLSNALRHGSGPLTVTVVREGDDTVCRIANAAGAKPNDGSSTGLGLRIVRAVAALHPNLAFATRSDNGDFIAELRWQATTT